MNNTNQQTSALFDAIVISSFVFAMTPLFIASQLLGAMQTEANKEKDKDKNCNE